MLRHRRPRAEEQREPCSEGAMSRSRNRATLGNPLSGLRSRDGNEVPLSITTQRRSMRAASRRPPRYSARARSRSRLEHHDAAPRGARRVPRRAHRLSSRRTTRATPTLAAPMRGASRPMPESLVVAERHPIHRASVCLLVSGDHPATPKTRRRPSLPRRPLLFEL